MENMICRKDRMVLLAEYGNPQIHKHYSKHILIANQPFICLIGHEEYTVCSAIIQSQISHSVRTEPDTKMVVFLIDESSDLSKYLDQEYLQESKFCPLPVEMEGSIVLRIISCAPLEEIDEAVICGLRYDGAVRASLDDRIEEAVKYIEESEILDQEIYTILSSRLCLSKSRFLHLFKQEMGIDLKNYLLLKRMEKAYHSVTQKHLSITEAAIMSGFSSSSHFATACKNHYGISLTDFLRAQKR